MLAAVVLVEHGVVPVGHAKDVVFTLCTETKESPPFLPQIVVPFIATIVSAGISEII